MLFSSLPKRLVYKLSKKKRFSSDDESVAASELSGSMMGDASDDEGSR